jgi:hypothetical protein
VLHDPGFSLRYPFYKSTKHPFTRFLVGGSFIKSLLLKGGSEGPCLGEVPCHEKEEQ